MIWVFEGFKIWALSKSFADNEKRAISAADTSAEQKSNKTMPNIPNKRVVFMEIKNNKLGPGSKFRKISYTN